MLKYYFYKLLFLMHIISKKKFERKQSKYSPQLFKIERFFNKLKPATIIIFCDELKPSILQKTQKTGTPLAIVSLKGQKSKNTGFPHLIFPTATDANFSDWQQWLKKVSAAIFVGNDVNPVYLRVRNLVPSVIGSGAALPSFEEISSAQANFYDYQKRFNRVQIVVPIYNAADDVQKCLNSLLKHTKLNENVSLLLIDDNSPDAEVSKVLAPYANAEYITVEKNSQNLGYTRNINKAIAMSGSGDIILLNSDTMVTAGWLEKLRQAAYQGEYIGTVTPVSNAAGCFSVPIIGDHPLPTGIGLQQMAELVEKVGENIAFDAPTGNGFCLYIKRKVFDSIGLFDEENFARGYGEENDFCMRAMHDGFLNIVLLNTYIYHKGHGSFSETRHELLEKSGLKLVQMYPEYPRLTEVFNTNPAFAAVKKRILKMLKQ